MKTFDSYELFITPLSPVHIGTGDSYEPTNYVIEDDALYEFQVGEVVEILSKTDRDSLLKAVDQSPNEVLIKSVQRFFYDRRSSVIACARHIIPVLEGVANLYRGRVGQTAQLEEGGRQVINRLEIDRTAYNSVTRQPVLFGSSLKGAIRTALLDAINQGQALNEVVDRKVNRLRRENNLEFQHRLLQFRAGKFELDPLRLVQVGDATWRGESGLPASEVHLAVNRKKVPVLDERGNLRPSQAEQKGPPQILECLPAFRHRALEAHINIQRVDGIDEAGKLPNPDLRFDICDIARACNAFYGTILKEENRLFADRGFLSESWRKAIGSLLAGDLGPRMDRGEAFLLRAGRHSGAESLTVRGVRNIKIMTGRGRRDEYSSTAKTVWLAAREPAQQKDMVPFGWLLLEVFPLGCEYRKHCDALRRVCEAQLAPARTWAARQAQIADQRLRRRFEVEARQHQQQEKASLEVDHQARLAAMSDEQRAIEDLLEIYEADKNTGRREPGGKLANCRLELLKQAKDWESVEMRCKAADLIEETVRWIPWPPKKRAERAKELEELRRK